jgi:thiol reductant ABC exporter CydC subunit
VTATSLTGYLARPAMARLPRLVLAAMLSLLSMLSGLALLATSAYLIQRASQQPPILSLVVATVGVRFFSLLRSISRYLERLATHDAVLRLLEDTRAGLFARLVPLAPAALDNDRSGDVIRRLVADVDSLQDMYARSLLPPVVAATVVGTAGAALALASGQLAVAVAAVALAGAVAVSVTAALTARSASERSAGLAGSLAAEVTDVVQGLADLLGMGAVESRIGCIEELDAALRRQAQHLAWSRALAGGFVTLATGMTVVAALLAGVLAASAGLVPAITVGVVAIAAMALTEPLSLISPAVDGVRVAVASGRRLLDIEARPVPVVDPALPLTLPPGGEVVLEDVSMRYGRDAPLALDGVSLRLTSGRAIGITGPSGSGKSSLAQVLVRFRDFESGTLSIGGVDVRLLGQDDIRRHVGLVSQDAHIFATSIWENLRLARPGAGAEEVRAAAERAQLIPWIDSLPEGWDTAVGENGARVSGGQRRRLALARALLADFPVLVVDEPTEALDETTAAVVMAEILAASQDRALLVTSHRDADLTAMDEVYAMGAGRLLRVS